MYSDSKEWYLDAHVSPDFLKLAEQTHLGRRFGQWPFAEVFSGAISKRVIPVIEYAQNDGTRPLTGFVERGLPYLC